MKYHLFYFVLNLLTYYVSFLKDSILSFCIAQYFSSQNAHNFNLDSFNIKSLIESLQSFLIYNYFFHPELIYNAALISLLVYLCTITGSIVCWTVWKATPENVQNSMQVFNIQVKHT